MTSRLGERTVGALAGSCVVILVTLIALLWTGVGTGVFSPAPRGGPGALLPDNLTRTESAAPRQGGSERYEPTPTPSTPPTTSKAIKLSIGDGLSGKEVEYVKPLKVSPLPLHEDDKLYGPDLGADDENQTQNLDPPAGRHHSGHFRHRMAPLWDPHPQYKFTAFGRQFHLFLSHDSGFVDPNLQVTNIWHNQTMKEHPGLEPGGCFYSGVVVGDPNSSVAVSLCHGMTGHIFSSWGSFFIEPAEHWHDHMTAILHAVYRTQDPRARPPTNSALDGDAVPHCGLADSDLLEPLTSTVAPKSGASSSGGRSKRSVNKQYNIEIMVVADKKMADYHGQGLNHYILSLMHTVNKFYKHASVGNPLAIAVVKIVVAREFDSSHHAKRKQGALAPEYLRKFCAWQASHNNNNDADAGHFDTALLLTRETLCRNANIPKCDTLGLAELGTMCQKNSSCSIVRDNGLSAAFTIAHELGHVLNMLHDDDERCRPFHSTTKMNNVMSRMLDSNSSPYSWSNCSRHFVTEFLDGGNGDCLLDEPFTNEVDNAVPADWLPGENFTEDQQCELVNGPGSKICSYMPKCSKLWCNMDAAEQKGCKTNHMPWADGTACKPHHWCQQGSCVPRDRRVLAPVDGGWGDWQAWGECSRSCGGGVKRAVRYCDNPRNLNGGQYCLGHKIRYKSCNTHDCPPGTKDFREEQCSQHDGNNFKIQGLPHNVTWVPKYGGLTARERCMLFCRVAGISDYYALRNQVIDGTTCGPDVHDICVAGTCKPAGCNRSLETDLKLDFCGECGGDNSSCHWIEGTYNESRYGYHQVVRVPAGSSNIDVRQSGYLGLKDDNYLVLVDGDSGEYLLNGKYSVTNYVKTIAYAGAKVQYSGSDAVVERLNSSHPIQRDLVIQVMSVGKAYPPNIEYKYTTMTHNYQWVVRAEWTACDKVCHGQRRQVVSCVRLGDGLEVGDGYCSNKAKPDRDGEECNTHCTLVWTIVSRGECSAHCGPGQRHLSARCEQRLDSGRTAVPVQDGSCSHVPRPPAHEPCEGPCDRHHWQYREWEACSLSSGACAQRRDAVCVDELNREVESSACADSELIAHRQCRRTDCPLWVTDDHWTPCSVTCGEGESNRAYYCQLNSMVVSPHACHAQPLPLHKRPCNARPCVRLTTPATTPSYIRESDNVISNVDDLPDYGNSIDSKLDIAKGSWRTGSWGECSRSCGGGTQRRQVKCVAERPGVEPRCNPSEKPKEVVHCSKEPCPAWKYGMWGECNSSCGLGFRHRQVGCQSSLGEIVDDQQCATLEREPHYEECPGLPACTPERKQPRWKMGPWGPCSRSCGQGVRVRSVECAAPDGRCDPRSRPKNTRVCKQLPCPNSWVVSDWTECSVSCGAGVQRRAAVCNALDRDESQPNFCHGVPRPSELQPCQMPSCDSHFYWRAAEWQQCSHACGKKGRQIRNISCYHRLNKKVPRYNCPSESKPRRKRKCNQRKCTSEFASCADVQRKQKATEDREYQLTLHGRVASIYCHMMRSTEPQEFLTLPNERDNYAEIYDRRLLKPDTCPDGGRRRDSCACVQDAEGKAGLTVYQRIRLNITSFRVNTQDVTFARQVKGSRVAYAESGDCYSHAECPQGRFGVDLKGTPFKVSRLTEWEGHGSSTSVDVRRLDRDQRVAGKCGGYCGTCSPKSRHGLTLDWLQPP